MKQRNFPNTQLFPPVIRGAEEGSFANYTICVRLPDIAQRVIDENDFSSETNENIKSLIKEIPDGLIRPLKDNHARDLAVWESYIKPYQNMNWLDISWFLAETYFYRRILEATDYFQYKYQQYLDPFAYQKNLGLETAGDAIPTLSAFVDRAIDAVRNQNQNKDNKSTNLIKLLHFNLWGNRADLSLWPVGKSEKQKIESETEKSNILVDDSFLIAEKVADFNRVRIDLIVDNAGYELVTDLCIVDFLLSTDTAGVIYLHLKSHPTFVSDAMIQDVLNTVDFLMEDEDENLRSLGIRLHNYIGNRQLRLRENLFWTSPLPLWEMPDSLYQDFAKSSLVFLKGDANYRRSLGDRHWDFTTPYQDIVNYFPAPLVALRTLKSELATGLSPQQIEEISQVDSEWLTNGKRGVIQLVD